LNEKNQLGFIHKFIPSNIKVERKGGSKKVPTFLLLHGTGGNEEDLIPVAREISSEAAILSPRGKILEDGIAARFFRRLAEGVFDLEDLRFRTNELANFVNNASKTYGFDLQHVIALGYSNGANIASSMLLLRPEVLSAAILFRSMVPFVPNTLPDLSNKYIFMSSGLYDPIIPKQEAERLFSLFKNGGAKVSISWQNSGHELVMEDVKKAKESFYSSSLLSG
jgi:phospholipase/carboxylesterase/glyoxalase family protein